ncbi:MAG TPA: hypothetical protein PK777_01460, partial [Thermoguttaceae bacterium]|nr:hypothetical protein [Thermoguttaceae bacterium]
MKLGLGFPAAHRGERLRLRGQKETGGLLAPSAGFAFGSAGLSTAGREANGLPSAEELQSLPFLSSRELFYQTLIPIQKIL